MFVDEFINIKIQGRKGINVSYVKVYKITNTVNGKLYVGITNERYLSHRFWYHANRKRSSGAYLHWSIKKYGKHNFTIELVDEYPTAEEAKQREIELISLWQLNKHRYPDGIGMNLTDGGDGSYGCKHSAESIQKMSGPNNHNYGLTGALHPRSQPVKQLTIDGNLVQIFPSMHDAARHVRPNCTPKQESSVVSNIRSCIIKRRGMSHAYGYKWELV